MGAALAESSWEGVQRQGAPSVDDAYRHCASVVRASGSSFAAAFWMLPRERRRALHAVYAFCRLADDIADDPAVRGDRRRLLARWRDELEASYDGRARTAVAIALGDAVRRFALPREILHDLLAGVESDLAGETIETQADLARYCYRVASTVGLLLVRILGHRSPGSLAYAAEMGIAVQLTNVLRDVGADARSGRVYLPREDLERFGVAPADLRGPMTERVRCLLALQAERARIRYERAEALLPPEDRRRLAPAEAMGGIYRTLLETLHRRGFPCLGEPLRLSRGRRLAIAGSVWIGVPRALERLRREAPSPCLAGR